MFPITVTVHNPSQLNAVLRALQPHLAPSDFADPAVAAAYAEVSQRVARQALADIEAAAATPLPTIDPPMAEVVADLQRRNAEAGTPPEAVNVELREVAAAPVDPPAPTPAATETGKPARGRRTAAAAAATAAPEKTAAASSPTAAPAAAEPQASTAATDDAPTVTYDGDVKPLILALVKARGRDVATGVLGEFGASTGPQLKTDQYAAFVARAREMLDEVPA